MSEHDGLRLLLAVDGSAHSQVSNALVAGLPWPPGSSATVLAVVRQEWSLLGLGLKDQAEVQATLRSLQRVAWGAAAATARQAAEAVQRPALSVTIEVREGQAAMAILQRATSLAMGQRLLSVVLWGECGASQARITPVLSLCCGR